MRSRCPVVKDIRWRSSGDSGYPAGDMTMSELAMTSTAKDPRRRRFLVAVTTVVGSIGVAALAVPFISAMNPSARARSAGAPVNADVSKLEPGQQITVNWRGKPVWILRRTPQMLDDLRSAELREHLRDPDSTMATQQPDYAQNVYRSIKPEYLVVIAICTHLGCVPWPDGCTRPCRHRPTWSYRRIGFSRKARFGLASKL